MKIKEYLEELNTLQKDSDTLQEIINVTGSKKENILEDIKALQKNEIPANINNIKRKIDSLDEYIDGAEQEYTEAYDDCQNAISSLENLSYDLDYISDCRTSIESLRETLEETEDEQDEEVAKKTTAKKTTPVTTDEIPPYNSKQ